MVDKDDSGYSADELRAWKHDHEAMIAEVRQQGWSRSIELLRPGQNSPGLAREIVALMEDRRAFWARFDAEFPDRVRMSLVFAMSSPACGVTALQGARSIS
ncbi:MAG TPA: hypothetical protein VGG79_19855 [Roseiarcus sp.]|jgi:hypothetical protein